MHTANKKKSATTVKSHGLYNGDSEFMTFSEVRDPRTEDYDGPVLLVRHEGDGELLSETFLVVEKARALYAQLRKQGWVKT
jgi:hypothetical protein